MNGIYKTKWCIQSLHIQKSVVKNFNQKSSKKNTSDDLRYQLDWAQLRDQVDVVPRLDLKLKTIRKKDFTDDTHAS
jgi:hypothetical protein